MFREDEGKKQREEPQFKTGYLGEITSLQRLIKPVSPDEDQAVLSVRQWHRDCPTVVASPQPPAAPLPQRAHLTFLSAALDCSSLRLCRAEALVALGQYPEALEDLDAVCRAEPGEHEVSEGHSDWSQILLHSSSFPLSSVLHWIHPAQKCT